jgi:hypothetical protein
MVLLDHCKKSGFRRKIYAYKTVVIENKYNKKIRVFKKDLPLRSIRKMEFCLEKSWFRKKF